MSAAVATPTLCACGCGQPVHGRRFLNARHKERAAPPKPKVYPHYVSSTLREDFCKKHQRAYTQLLIGSQPVSWFWSGDCPACALETQARVDARKPKPRSACEARTCKCPAPKCPDCGHPMTMGPGSLGWHSWVCCDAGLAEDTKAEGGIIAKPLIPIGTHRAEQWTGWRDSCQ